MENPLKSIFKKPDLPELSKQKALTAFQRFCSFPLYSEFLASKGIKAESFKDINFTDIPILDKSSVFAKNNPALEQLIHQNIANCAYILPSSGFSGEFSFGLSSSLQASRQAETLTANFKNIFQIHTKKTLLINALSMGINIPVSGTTTINTGVRPDIILHVIKTFISQFDQLIIIGEPNLLKNILEDGREEGIPWEKHDIRLILGGESFPEQFRTYLQKILGIGSSETIKIGASFGFAEMGLNVLFETPSTIKLRKLLDIDEPTRQLIFGNIAFTPMLLHPDPLSTYVEEDAGQLLFTSLDPGCMLPIVRYATGDSGKVLTKQESGFLLEKHEYRFLFQDLGLPLIGLTGRKKAFLEINSVRITPELIKYFLYSSPESAPAITGLFRLSSSSDKLKLEIQLKKNKQEPKNFCELLRLFISQCGIKDPDVVFTDYDSFPYAMENSYERKFKYIS